MDTPAKLYIGCCSGRLGAQTGAIEGGTKKEKEAGEGERGVGRGPKAQCCLYQLFP